MLEKFGGSTSGSAAGSRFLASRKPIFTLSSFLVGSLALRCSPDSVQLGMPNCTSGPMMQLLKAFVANSVRSFRFSLSSRTV
jgi:hypothetical protein